MARSQYFMKKIFPAQILNCMHVHKSHAGKRVKYSGGIAFAHPVTAVSKCLAASASVVLRQSTLRSLLSSCQVMSTANVVNPRQAADVEGNTQDVFT